MTDHFNLKRLSLFLINTLGNVMVVCLVLVVIGIMGVSIMLAISYLSALILNLDSSHLIVQNSAPIVIILSLAIFLSTEKISLIGSAWKGLIGWKARTNPKNTR